MVADRSTAPALPEWADRIRRTYLRGESSMFLLHHNVFDRVVWNGKLLDVEEFLIGALLGSKKQTIVVYDPARGVRVVKRAPELPSLDGLSGKRAPAEVLPALEELLLASQSTALIIKYADMLAPAGEMQFLSEQDRVSTVSLHRWSLDTRLADRDNVVFVIAEQISSVHPMLVSNPRVASIQLPMPDLATRTAVCSLADASLTQTEAEQLGTHTAGLKALQIHGLLSPDASSELDDEARYRFILGLLGASADAEPRARKLSALTRSMNEDEIRHLLNPQAVANNASKQQAIAEVLSLVRTRKREIIEKECFGLIEFMDPSHGFEAVGGMDEIKKELSKVAAAIRAGDRARVPMGLLLVGPMGTGKTFVAGAFARESAIPAIKLKNFRSKWVGATESNLEKVLTIIRALGPILLVIDEGDRSFGDGGESDGGTSSRVIARIKEFMSDPDNRGLVVFMLMTNRPDKLDVDIKRAGRLDRKIPFFYASTPEEVEGILTAQLKRHRIANTLDWQAERARTSAALVGYSNADLEAVALLALELSHDASRPVDGDILERAVRDYLPSRDEAMLRYMELLAVFEASNRRMLPPKYRDLSNEDLGYALREARALVAAGTSGRTA
jgi:ATP-dependent 26S proteasome regulatory subunit